LGHKTDLAQTFAMGYRHQIQDPALGQGDFPQQLDLGMRVLLRAGPQNLR
jgi:hypothetical protein